MKEAIEERLAAVIGVRRTLRDALADFMSFNRFTMGAILDSARDESFYEDVSSRVIAAYRRQFDDESLSVICDFLDSKAGRSFTNSMPKVNAEIAEAVKYELVKRALK